MKTRLTRRAQANLDDSWLHIAELSQNTEAAPKVIRSLEDAIDAVGQNPNMGRRRDLDLRAGLRSFVVDQHVVVYRRRRSSVSIAGIFHHTQNLPTLFQ